MEGCRESLGAEARENGQVSNTTTLLSHGAQLWTLESSGTFIVVGGQGQDFGQPWSLR